MPAAFYRIGWCLSRNGVWTFQTARPLWIRWVSYKQVDSEEDFRSIVWDMTYETDSYVEIDLGGRTYVDHLGNLHPIMGAGMTKIELWGRFLEDLDYDNLGISWAKEGF